MWDWGRLSKAIVMLPSAVGGVPAVAALCFSSRLGEGGGGSVEVSACTPLEREGLVYVPWQPGHPG